MGIVIHDRVYQHSPEWYALRCGILTASTVCKVMTAKTLKLTQTKAGVHDSDLLYELLSQRVTKHVDENTYQSVHMMRGAEDEIDARNKYEAAYGEVKQVGFVTNDEYGFTLGYSPDGLVGDDGQIEAKSRMDKFQIETILRDEVPEEYMLQIQTGLLVTKRKWCDFISYCGGLYMFTKRVFPNVEMMAAIVTAGRAFEARIEDLTIQFAARIADPTMRLLPTERRTDYGFNNDISASE